MPPPAPLLSGALYDLTASYLVIYTTAALLTTALLPLTMFVRQTSAAPR